jgi:antitoxin component YwqK of YwqJK toxin-antitoxin module
MVGEWIYYDKKGNKIKKETYENNKLVSEETF